MQTELTATPMLIANESVLESKRGEPIPQSRSVHAFLGVLSAPQQESCTCEGAGFTGVAGQSPANNNPLSAPARASGDGLGLAKLNAPAQPVSHQSDLRAAETWAACEPRSGEVGLGRKPR